MCEKVHLLLCCVAHPIAFLLVAVSTLHSHLIHTHKGLGVMFGTPASARGAAGNLHPSVANRSPALASALQLSLGNGSSPNGKITPPPGASGGASSIDIDEAEARMRAREILQEFAREKSKAVEVEGQLHRASQDNEKLQHNIAEMKAEFAVEADRLKRMVENLKSEKLEAETRAASAREEAQKVTKAAAQRASDATSQLRLKEQEMEHLEAELTRARDEIRSLRKDLVLSRDQDAVTEDMSRVQFRVVELARKLLEAEKSKTEMQKALVEDRKQLHQALSTIDALRAQLADGERRSMDTQSTRDKDIAQFQLTIDALHNEMQHQRDLYQRFVETVSKADGAHRSNAVETEGSLKTRVAVLETQLAASSQLVQHTQRQLDDNRTTSESLRRELNAERALKHEEVTALQARIGSAEERVVASRKEVAERRELHEQLNERFSSLSALYENATKSLQARNDSFATLEHVLLELQNQHNAIAAEMEFLRSEVAARDAAVASLQEAIKEGTIMEQRLREQSLIHQHEKELMRLQFLRNGPSALLGSPVRGGHNEPGAIELAPHMDLANMQHQVAVLEAEKARWIAERTSVLHQTEGEKRLLSDELRSAKKALEDTLLESAQLRSQALHNQREVEEWRLAFHSSERAKHRLEHQLSDIRDAAASNQKDKNTSDVQVALLSQHVERLEGQAERDAREIFRLRREAAMAEVSLAKQRLSSQVEEIYRVERQEVTDSASALLRERELIQLRMGRQARERELADKEVALQRLHEAQLQDITKQGSAASPKPAKHQDPATRTPEGETQ
jgi:chromosome segregation ATPase